MRRLLLLSVAFAAGAAVFALAQSLRKAPLPSSPSVAQRIRAVAKLETLEVTLYKKVSFAPDPAPQPSAWGDVMQWVRYSVRPPQGRAIVFAKAHLGYDLSQLTAAQLTVDGDRVTVELPSVQCHVELLPAETEVVSSSLDSAQTAELLEKARVAFEREVKKRLELSLGEEPA